MKLVDLKQIRAYIKGAERVNLYLCYGSDTLMVQTATRLLLKTFTGSDTGEYATKYEGDQLDLSTLADDCDMFPMFVAYNCVVIHDLNMEQIKDTQKKTLLGILESLPEQTVVIIFNTGFDIYGGKTGKAKKPTAKNKVLLDFVEKHGVLCMLEPKSVSQTASDITASVKKQGCTIDHNAAILLAQQCKGESMRIKHELDKLCAYVDGGEICTDLVEAMVVPQLKTTVYALTRAILRCRPRDAFEAVENLLSMQMDMGYLFAVVSGSFLDIQRATAARENGKTVRDVMEDFFYRYSFMVENAFQDAMGKNSRQISACLQIITEAQTRLHTTEVDQRVLFESCIVQMLQEMQRG